MEFLRQSQADIMLLLTGICGTIALLVCMTNTMSTRRKVSLMLLEISAMVMMISDRQAYIFRGDTSRLGWWMVRISNFLVFFLTMAVLFFFNRYLMDLLTNEGHLQKPPRRLKAAQILSLIGMALVIVSQFTGIFYTFDAMNRYQRAPGFILCYISPFSMLVLQLSVIVQYYRSLRVFMRLSLLLFACLSIGASVLQIFLYGISLNNMFIAIAAVLLYIFALNDMTREVERARSLEIDYYRIEKENEHTLFEQTAEALASAIDAKDPYTNGHSRRVAEYSLQIARAIGKSPEECDRIYFTALLHDVGKIGIPLSIINKKGRLTDEEFDFVKRHTVLGGQILSTIKQSPWLSIGARYHHERYGGRGYPEGISGKAIPEIARIIAVADAYDAMTSNRSYRNAIPQHIVKEEIVKGIGTQFDPEFAKAMLHMIDLDTEYRMQESNPGAEHAPSTSLRCDAIYNDCSEGVIITRKPTLIRFCSQPDDGLPDEACLPSLIVYDALDGQVHPGEENNRNVLYCEYARIRLDGRVTEGVTRRSEVRTLDQESDLETAGFGEPERGQRYRVEAVRYRDQALIRISDENRIQQVILALPDTSRFVYIALGGEHCYLHNILVESAGAEIGPEDIPRIAEEISYIKDQPTGDIPSIEVEGWCASATQGIPVGDGMTLTFHSMSLPAARLVWHCPYISLFSSRDGRVNGPDFREYMLLRLYGENWESDEHAENSVRIRHTEAFVGWNAWKEQNRQGLDCQVTIHRDGNTITMLTENLGIAVKSKTMIRDRVKNVYVALTGDQCAITNIRVSRPHG